MDILVNLLNVEERIEELYLLLVHLEINGQIDTEYYNQVVKEIFDLTKKEKELLIQKGIVYEDLRREVKKQVISSYLPIYLGFHTHASSFRLYNMLESISGDPGIEYADALNYDIYRILFKFLEYIVDNPYYEDIRDDLIYFKYDIIFRNYNIESDFILKNDMTSISLDSRNLKEDLPSSKYIDQAILVLEIEEAVKQILSVSDTNSFNAHTLIVIKIMQILARMALCTEDELAFVIDDVHYLLESEEVDLKIKETFLEMTDIFKQIQNSFYFSR